MKTLVIYYPTKTKRDEILNDNKDVLAEFDVIWIMRRSTTETEVVVIP